MSRTSFEDHSSQRNSFPGQIRFLMSRPLFDADYSAIEARIVCWLAGQEDALNEYRQGIDRYKRMASFIYGIPEEEVNKHPQRFIGKQAILLCGFQGAAFSRGHPSFA